MTESVIKTCITPHFTLVIDNEDGTSRTWKLCYDYRSIAAIEEATGLDLKKIDAWKSISSGKQFPAIVWGGLHRYNPDVSLDEVLDVLNPQAQRLLSDEIFTLMFPGVVEAFKKQQEAEAAGETASPNANVVPQSV